MKIDRILTELVIFAREHDGEAYEETRDVIKAAERHLDWVLRGRSRRARLANARKPTCERCERPSTSGILCWPCLGLAPVAIRRAFIEASGVEAMRAAAEQVRAWIRTSVTSEIGSQSERREAA